IKEYIARYPNITYLKLTYDPGIYAVWNLGIKMARAPFITNANLDDRLKFDCYQVHLNALINNPSIDLVYSDFYITQQPNETFENHSRSTRVHLAQFSLPALQKKCLPNNHPMWRKSMHDSYGYFNATYKSAGDWEMWKRAAHQGSRFLKVDGAYGLFYYNPEGLSTNPHNTRIQQEEYKVRRLYTSPLT
ncbi:MAG: glycosyltransferase, partial [Candidatus Babeliales bacterium]|nr:glycosyltransferase [Candidatus Babeliales bacterium]